jgi:hypothetical protein
MKKFIFGICAASLSIIFPANLFAEQCTNYKYSQLGVKVIDTEEGPKIVSTGQASVLIDDIDEVKDAFDEARLEAKAEIVKFYNDETLQEECNSGENVIKNRTLTKNFEGETGTYNKTRIKETLCNTRTSTAGLLKGVVTVEQCYQKGEYVKLTIGISPKTLKQAANIKDNINYGMQDTNSSNTINNSDGLVPTDGFYYVDEDF